MIILLTFLILLLLTTGFAVMNLLRKVEIYEDFCTSMLEDTNYILNQITTIDANKSFETDDEVGIMYQGIRGMIRKLSEFLER